MNYPQIDSWQNTRVALGGNQTVRGSTSSQTQRSSTQSGTPLPVNITSIFSTKSGSNSVVSVTYQINPADQSLRQVAIWVKGYLKSSNPIKITETTDSPATFILQSTDESISVIAQSIGKDGSILDLSKCPSKGIVL